MYLSNNIQSELSSEGTKQDVEKKLKRTRPNCIKAQRFHQGLPAVPSGLVAKGLVFQSGPCILFILGNKSFDKRCPVYLCFIVFVLFVHVLVFSYIECNKSSDVSGYCATPLACVLWKATDAESFPRCKT